MTKGDHLGFAGVVLAFVSIGISIRYSQRPEIGIAAFVLALLVCAVWLWVYRTGSVASLRSDWLELEEKFQGVHDAAPRPTPGVPWYGGNPHPFATEDGQQWNLRGENTELKKQMEVLCFDAGTLLLKSPRLKRTLKASIRRGSDPIRRWLMAVHESQGFTKNFHGEHRSGNKIETTETGLIEFLPNVSVRVARRCAAIS
jgi:hypothetical protein